MLRTIRYTSPLKELSDYVVFDTETTGVDPDTDRIIEVGLIAVKDNIIVDRFGSFVNPGCSIPASASKVNHIFDRDVADAPSYQQIAPILAEWLIGKTVIAHNAQFDMKLVRSLLSEANYSGTIKYVDTLFYARRVVSDVENYKLQTLAEHFSIDTGDAHRAVDDAITCHYLFQECKALTSDDSFGQKSSNSSFYESVQAKDFFPSHPVSPDSPLYDKIVVFTGDLSISRSSAMQMAVDAGAIIKDNLTLNTDYLVEGVQNPYYVKEGELSNKQKTAREINSNGKGKIQIISESEFFKLCGVKKESKSRQYSSSQKASQVSSSPKQKKSGTVLRWILTFFLAIITFALFSVKSMLAVVFFLLALLAAPISFFKSISAKKSTRRRKR